jgi:hypothetical protein
VRATRATSRTQRGDERRAAGDAVPVVAVRRRGEALVGRGGGEQLAQAPRRHRLDHVVEHGRVQREQRRLDGGLAGDEHDLGAARQVELVEQLEAVAVGQREVDQREVEAALAQARHALRERAGDGDVEAFLARDLGRGVHEADVVVDDEEMGLGLRLRVHSIRSAGIQVQCNPCNVSRLEPNACTPRARARRVLSRGVDSREPRATRDAA